MPLPDYNRYTLTRKDILATVFRSSLIIAAVSLLCYDNIYFSLLLTPYIFYCLARNRKKKLHEQKWKLNLQFSDAIQSIGAALEAGYSVENSMGEAYRDLKLSYSEDEPIMRELKNIIYKLRNNITVEEAFGDLAVRSGLEDVAGFADVFATAKRTGGNIIAIIRSTTDVVRTRIDLKRELMTVTAAPKYECDIMKAVPFGIILYLRLFCPDMMAGLYGNTGGIITMSVVLILYVILCEVSERITDIEF